MSIDKRTLKQQYREAASRAGVYLIRNRIARRAWVAGSSNVEGALNRHRFELRMGSHRDPLLSSDWSQHGEASFEFEVLDRVRPRDDPAFDAARELETLLTLWRQEVFGRVAEGYEALVLA